MGPLEIMTVVIMPIIISMLLLFNFLYWIIELELDFIISNKKKKTLMVRIGMKILSFPSSLIGFLLYRKKS